MKTNLLILVDNFSCNGSENNLTDCAHSKSGSDISCDAYVEEAMVSCICK